MRLLAGTTTPSILFRIGGGRSFLWGSSRQVGSCIAKFRMNSYGKMVEVQKPGTRTRCLIFTL